MGFFYIFLAMLCFIIISCFLILSRHHRKTMSESEGSDADIDKPARKERLRDEKGRFVKSK